MSSDLGTTFRTGAYQCPSCGKSNDAHTKAHGDSGGPDQDSWMICYYCENFYRFDSNMVPRCLTEEEDIEVNLDPDVAAALYALKSAKAKGGSE